MAIPEKFKNIVHITNLIEIGLKVDFLEDIREIKEIKEIEEGKSWKDKLNYIKCKKYPEQLKIKIKRLGTHEGHTIQDQEK